MENGIKRKKSYSKYVILIIAIVILGSVCGTYIIKDIKESKRRNRIIKITDTIVSGIQKTYNNGSRSSDKSLSFFCSILYADNTLESNMSIEECNGELAKIKVDNELFELKYKPKTRKIIIEVKDINYYKSKVLPE